MVGSWTRGWNGWEGSVLVEFGFVFWCEDLHGWACELEGWNVFVLVVVDQLCWILGCAVKSKMVVSSLVNWM